MGIVLFAPTFREPKRRQHEDAEEKNFNVLRALWFGISVRNVVKGELWINQSVINARRGCPGGDVVFYYAVL